MMADPSDHLSSDDLIYSQSNQPILDSGKIWSESSCLARGAGHCRVHSVHSSFDELSTIVTL